MRVHRHFHRLSEARRFIDRFVLICEIYCEHNNSRCIRLCRARTFQFSKCRKIARRRLKRLCETVPRSFHVAHCMSISRYYDRSRRQIRLCCLSLFRTLFILSLGFTSLSPLSD